MMVAGIILGVFVLGSIIIYNSLVGRRNEVENSFSGIDVQLKKRYDLIPNLVSTVKQYAAHEKGLLEKITMLRAQAIEAEGQHDTEVQINNEITRSLGALNIAVENYPDLKASKNFNDLQSTLNEVEGQISAARRAFNAAATDYNNGVQMFPSNIFAGLFGFKERALFEAPPEERKNHNVKDLFAA